MKHEAKFSVILSSSNLTGEQIKTLEETVSRNGLEITLPLKLDAEGNYVLASGMSLREAQLLRRQVSSYGYTADVTSDAANDKAPGGSLDTLVVDLATGETLSGFEMPTESWGSIEMPTSLDLGLSDDLGLGEPTNTSEKSDADSTVESSYTGENWLDPEALNDENVKRMPVMDSQKTMSLSVDDLLKAAQAGGGDIASLLAQPSLDVSAMLKGQMADASNDSQNADNDKTTDGLNLGALFDQKSGDDEKTTDCSVIGADKSDRTGEFAAPDALLAMASDDGANASDDEKSEDKKSDDKKSDDKKSDDSCDKDSVDSEAFSSSKINATPEDNKNSSENIAEKSDGNGGSVVPKVFLAAIVILLVLVCVHIFVLPLDFLNSVLSPLF